MKVLDFRNYRPLLLALGCGFLLSNSLTCFAIAASAHSEGIPFVVKITPAVGIFIGVILMLLGGHRPVSARDTSQEA